MVFHVHLLENNINYTIILFLSLIILRKNKIKTKSVQILECKFLSWGKYEEVIGISQFRILLEHKGIVNYLCDYHQQANNSTHNRFF